MGEFKKPTISMLIADDELLRQHLYDAIKEIDKHPEVAKTMLNDILGALQSKYRYPHKGY